MEDQLKSLMSASIGPNRTKWAHEWRTQGKKVVGVLDCLVPEEVIYAAGMLPWRIRGTWRPDVSRAMQYRLPHGSTFLHHVMESLLGDEIGPVDGVVCSDRDEDFLRFSDYWQHLSSIPLVDVVEVPVIDSELTRRRFTAKIREFMASIERFGETEVSDKSLRDAISTYNEGNSLLRQVYEMRKKSEPPLSGGEALAITMAATVMPRHDFNKELKGLIPYLRERKAGVSQVHPRVMLSSDLLDNPAFVDVVEEAGCLVAMDDLDTGSRYFWEAVDGGGADPAHLLAVRYLKDRSPRMYDWRGQAGQLVQWVNDFKIDGILELPDMYDYTRGFRKPFLERWLKEAGVPFMSFERDYYLANVGQLKTRVEAFIETLESEVVE